jgi:ABC-type multidrug transport system fused ATPase/permease subunit
VINNGTIIEQGTHAQLIENNSLYAAQVRAGETFEA